MDNNRPNEFPIIRQCQQSVADTVENTYLCSISDAGEQLDIHPKNKKVVGERLALLARKHVYDEEILADAPCMESVTCEKNVVTITWANAGDGIKVKGDVIECLHVFAGEEEKEEKEKPALLFAPDCLERNGKYYLYFCMPDDSEGVAISDRPEGPFTNPIQLPCGGIDPAIFIDDDGQAYYYWGQLFSHGVKLNEDMISFNRDEVVDDLVTEEEHFFHEGSSMRKIGDTYYYVYADVERGKPTSLGYSTSKSPMGPFTYRGIIIDNDGCDPASWNNHGSIECVNGQWYVFYHRCSRGAQQHRRLCIEKIEILEDGTIPEVKMTSQGIGEPFASSEVIKGYQACEMSGSVYIGVNEDVESVEEYPEVLMNISAGDEVMFRYVKSEQEWKEISLKYRGSGKVKVKMNETCAGEITLADNKDVTNTTNQEICMEAGEYELELEIVEADKLEINYRNYAGIIRRRTR